MAAAAMAQGPPAVHGAVPDDLREGKMRACLMCHVVQTLDQFILDGCPNCPQDIPARSSEDTVRRCSPVARVCFPAHTRFSLFVSQVLEATSQHFDGLAAVFNPRKSWVARWERIGGGFGVSFFCSTRSASDVFPLTPSFDFDWLKQTAFRACTR
jgi:Spt4/RpoE2 zinc finger